MSIEIKIPTLGESIAGGLISKWHKADGESVKKGDILLTLETDKVAQDIAAESGGVVRHRAKEGDEVTVGALVAVIEEDAKPELGSRKSEVGDQRVVVENRKPEVEAPQLKIVPKPR